MSWSTHLVNALLCSIVTAPAPDTDESATSSTSSGSKETTESTASGTEAVTEGTASRTETASESNSSVCNEIIYFEPRVLEVRGHV